VSIAPAQFLTDTGTHRELTYWQALRIFEIVTPCPACVCRHELNG
jgi:hypothetical protein